MKKNRLVRATWVALVGLCCATAQAVTIRLSCAGSDQEISLCREAALSWSKKSGHVAEVVVGSNQADERLRDYQRLFIEPASSNLNQAA